MNTTRKSYPSDVTDLEWHFLLPYLTLMREDAPSASTLCLLILGGPRREFVRHVTPLGTFGWLGRFRRLARDYERLAETLKGWHWIAAVILLLNNQFSSA